jgi:acetyl esterase/lipase
MSTALRRLGRLVPVVAGLALLASTTTSCQWPPGTRYVYEVFDAVDVTRDVVYRTTTTWDGQRIDLRLDIYQPRGDTARERPAIMWMHGGGWVGGDRSLMSGYATDSAERGYVGVSIQYRLRPQPSQDAVFDAYDDAVAAVAWLKAHAAQYRIDPDAIVAGGHSAGAFNAMHLLYTPGERGPATSPIAGGVALAGFSFSAPSPGDPPAVMLAGSADTIVRLENVRTTCDDARSDGNTCDLIVYEGRDHLFPYQIGDQVQADLHDRVFEHILWPLGYRPETVP